MEDGDVQGLGDRGKEVPAVMMCSSCLGGAPPWDHSVWFLKCDDCGQRWIRNGQLHAVTVTDPADSPPQKSRSRDSIVHNVPHPTITVTVSCLSCEVTRDLSMAQWVSSIDAAIGNLECRCGYPLFPNLI